MSVRILIGDCRARMAELPDASVDSVVCDPPYHLTSIVKRFAKANPEQEVYAGKTTGAYKSLSRGFMGQTWDGGDVAFDPETWAEVLRVLKPGGHLIAFSGTRTYHRMAVAIEDAGFEIRDQLAWVYGSGFPKSLDVSKQIDKAAGAEREVVSEGSPVKRMIPGATQNKQGWIKDDGREFVPTVTAPATDAAREWQGWGTALKPSWEPICLARKPLAGTVAANVLAHGTGALNIDSCRIEAEGADLGRNNNARASGTSRWPANLCHDGSDEVLAGFPDSVSTGGQASLGAFRDGKVYGAGRNEIEKRDPGFGDSGSAARFFAQFPMGEEEWEFANSVQAASSVESQCGLCGTPIAGDPAATLTLGSSREESQAGPACIGICSGCILSLNLAPSAASQESIGTTPTIPNCSKSNGSATPAIAPITRLENGEKVEGVNGLGSVTRFLYCPKTTTEERGEGNNHPTVKPVALMRWLCRLVTPKGGTVLDPFMGSGSTMIAADAEQFDAIGCELSADYAAIAERRIREAAGMFADVTVSRAADKTAEAAA